MSNKEIIITMPDDSAIVQLELAVAALRKEHETLRMQIQLLSGQVTDTYVSKSEAGRLLGVSHTQIRRLIAAGKIREIGGKCRKSDLERHMIQKDRKMREVRRAR